MPESEIERLRRELEQERRKNQNTTLDEYLYNCHYHLYQKLDLAHPSQSSTGFTKVDGKYYPKWLRPWDDFKNTQRPRHFEVIRKGYGGRRLLHQESTTRDLGTTIARKRAGNESAVEHFEKLAVEDPVWEVLRPLWDDEGLRSKYRCAGLRFSNNRRDVKAPSSVSQETQEGRGEEGPERGRRARPSKRVASESRVRPPPTKPDGWGVRTHPNGEENHAFVYDYKAAHKVAAGSAKSIVSKETLFMEVVLRVNSSKTQNNADERGHGRTEELIAMALVQVFDYMVRYEVAYGYVAAGGSLLFLHVDRSDLQTLYCHPCVPEEDVGDLSVRDRADNGVAYTAVAQLASFCLLTLLSSALRGASLDDMSHAAEATLQAWPEPYGDAGLILSAEDTESPSAPSASSSQATDANFTSSAGATGRKIGLRSKSSCRTTDEIAEDDEDDDARPSGPPPSSHTHIGSRKRKEGPGSPEEEDATVSEDLPTRPYCTQKCLLGLKRGWALDGDCPNVDVHRTAEGDCWHPIIGQDVARLVDEQLRRNPYWKCDALDRQRKIGSTGVLFKLELVPYGYTFVGKGAWSSLPTALEHETRIYVQLDRLQGDIVPVHLGMVSLDWGHAVAGGNRIYHMMLMSWAGEKAATSGAPDVVAESQRSSQAVWEEGVDHRDEHGNNMLWNAERKRVMVIDFDSAVLRPKRANKPLSMVAGTKRRRTRESLGNRRKRASVQGGVEVA